MPPISARSARRSSWSATSAFRGSVVAMLAMICAVVIATVCLPTYNERENVERMVRALVALGVRVLVVDDSSPDGTGELADRPAAELDAASVPLRARKQGPGPASPPGFPR